LRASRADLDLIADRSKARTHPTGLGLPLVEDVLLFVHIAGAAGWIGGGVFGAYSIGRLAKAGGASNGRAMEVIVEKAGVYFTIMFVLVVGAGVGLVLIEDEWGWGDTFIWFGIGAIVLSGVWQGLVAGKSDQRLLDAVKNESPNRLAVLGTWRRTAWVDVAILLVALWAMVTKLTL
jgi:hypothetical protein